VQALPQPVADALDHHGGAVVRLHELLDREVLRVLVAKPKRAASSRWCSNSRRSSARPASRCNP
jgi:hypothetical protein